MKKKKRLFLPAPFLTRLAIFFAVCIGIYLFRNWYNERYGHAVIAVYNWYQVFLFAPLLCLFSYVFRDRIRLIQHYPFRIMWSSFFSVLALVAMFIPFSFFDAWHFGTILTYFTVLYIAYACVFLAIFGPKFARLFAQELILFANGSLVFLLCVYLFDVYWKFFAFVILRALSVVLPVFVENAVVQTSDLSVTANGFRVIVGASCAGVYSMFLFLFFYVFSLYLLRRSGSIRKMRAILVLFASVFALFVLNVFRIAIIVFIGSRYSPEIAVSLFHEYAASVLFLIFLFCYFSYVMPLLIQDLTPSMLHYRHYDKG